MNNKHAYFETKKVGAICQSELTFNFFGREFSIIYMKIGKDYSIIFRFLNYEQEIQYSR